MIKIYDREVF